jgi:hypothetical protein
MKMMFKEVDGNDEAMRFIILADDDGVEVKKFPIYINKEMAAKLPVLSETYGTLPELFKMVYQSGLRGGVLESGILLDLGKLYYADQMSEYIQVTRFSKSTVIATVYMYKMYSDFARRYFWGKFYLSCTY